MKILITGQRKAINTISPSPASLASAALSEGHTLCKTLSGLPDLVICLDWSEEARSTILSATAREIPSVLVKREPSIVIPGHSDPEVDLLFSKVIEVGRPNGSETFRWPQTWNLRYFDNPKRLTRTVAISANKFSFLAGELYSLRLEVYSRVEGLDLYGQGWERRTLMNLGKMISDFHVALRRAPNRLVFDCLRNLVLRPKAFKGISENKLRTLSNYRTALVIENSMEFMSEKLLDSIFAGTIPIYVGPRLDSFSIPKELVVGAEPNLKSISQALNLSKELSYLDWKKAAAKWLSQPEIKELWDREHQYVKILNECISTKRD